jgi:hypothetical protein
VERSPSTPSNQGPLACARHRSKNLIVDWTNRILHTNQFVRVRGSIRERVHDHQAGATPGSRPGDASLQRGSAATFGVPGGGVEPHPDGGRVHLLHAPPSGERVPVLGVRREDVLLGQTIGSHPQAVGKTQASAQLTKLNLCR